MENVQRLSLIRPLKLHLERPLSGPYATVLRRPAPELAALATGACLVLLRARRLNQPLPLCASTRSPYGGGKARLQAADLRDPGTTSSVPAETPAGMVRLLAVPAGHVELPNQPWVSALLAELSPWRAVAVERWRRRLRQDTLWLNVLRLHTCTPQALKLPKAGRPQAKVKPFRLSQVRAVVPEPEFSRRVDDLLGLVERYSAGGLVPALPVAPGVEVEEFAQRSGYTPALLREWEERLRRKRQLILCGPPGTGKTFLARYLAGRMAGAAGFWDLVQFHPAFAYEDFIQGLRPVKGGGFELVPGRFLEFCRRATSHHPHPCALVIDEINRADLPRVLGEVMYLLEYRDHAIGLAGGGSPFTIPENVYLIGTMNSADRSIALVDQALRRRFAFIRLRPDYGLLRRHLEDHGLPAEGLIEVLEQLNQAIGDPDRELGCSFFLQDGPGLRQAMRQIWQGEIEPYLEEVFFDQPESLAAGRWELLARGPLSAWA